ncbi:MAG TPA: helix-turn-helix domain-containing protein, partial [Candidatus Limnocylindrales bacterium]|nr:helix-turn-helix domain-containing protein [Candidatus Limnocylindrales bacterium]
YCWPGNLRELGNFVKRYLVLENESLVIDELQIKGKENGAEEGGAAPASRGGLKALVRSLKDDAEAREIQRALENANWNRKLAAAELNISYKALLYKIKQHGLSPVPQRHFSLRSIG